MEELKTALQNELSHVRKVWFDEHGNWFINQVPSSVRSMTSEEILADATEEVKEETGSKKAKKK